MKQPKSVSKQRLIINFMIKTGLKMPTFNFGCIRILSRSSIRNRMNFFSIISILAFFATNIDAHKGLRYKGVVHNGQFDWSSLTPKEMQLIRKLIAIQRCRNYGRFC